jgi:hypothetical protein
VAGESSQTMKTLLTSKEKESSQNLVEEQSNPFGSFGNAVPTDHKNKQEDKHISEEDTVNVRSPKISVGRYSKDKNNYNQNKKEYNENS